MIRSVNTTALQRARNDFARDRRRAGEMILRSNPLLGLSVSQAQALYDAARVAHGSTPLLQRVYAEIESVDPVLLTCVERRAAALSEIGWKVEITGDDDAAATDQRDAVEDFVGRIDNLSDAIEHLGLAFFRGYSFAYPVWIGITVRRIDLLNTWNVIQSPDGDWRWNPECNPTADDLDPIGDDFLRVVCPRAIDYPAMFIFLRHHLAERDWGRYVERYGIPPVDAVMAETATEQDRPAYEDAADAARDGMSVVWPTGTTVSRADASRGADPFSALIEHQERLLVLMATGGTLTSLAQADTGTLAGGAQMDVWRQVVARIATVIGAELHRGLVLPFLRAAYPGQKPRVRLSLGRTPDPTPSEVLDMAVKAKSAGYVMDQVDLENSTGYRYTVDASPAGIGGFAPNGAAVNPQDAQKPFANPLQNARNDSDGEITAVAVRSPQSAKYDDSRSAEAAQAFCNDMAAVRNAIADILAADDITAAAKAAAPKIPGMMPRKSELAGVLREAMVDGVAWTVANKED